MSENLPKYKELSQLFQHHADIFLSITKRLEQAIQTIKSGALVGNPGMPLADAVQDRILSEAALLRSKFDELTIETERMTSNTTRSNHLIQAETPFDFTDPSLADFYQHVIPPTSIDLVPPSASKRIISLLEFFPSTLSKSLLFESRLHSIDEQVDVSLLINPNLDNGRELLGNPAISQFSGLSFIHQDVRWTKIIDFCQSWKCENSLLDQHISSIWLEFDLPQNHDEGIPLPSLFFNFKESNSDKHLDVTSEALRQLIEDHQIASYLFTIEHLTQMLQRPLPIRWIGVMLGRGTSDMRLYLELSQEEIYSTLETLGWLSKEQPANRHTALADLQHRLVQLSALCDRLILDITVTPNGIGDQIGVECGYKNNRQVQVEPRWRDLMNLLVDIHLCTPEKATAVLNWSGYSVAEFTSLGKTKVALRKLSHLKLKYRSFNWHQAKIYYQYTAGEVTSQSLE